MEVDFFVGIYLFKCCCSNLVLLLYIFYQPSYADTVVWLPVKQKEAAGWQPLFILF
jgi:hypothetical protein